MNNVSYVNSLEKKKTLLLPDLKKFLRKLFEAYPTMCNLIFVQETSQLQQNCLVGFFSHVSELLWRRKITANSTNVFLYFTGVGGDKKTFLVEKTQLRVRDCEKSAAHMKHWQSSQLFSATENNTAIISLVDSLPSTQQLKSKPKIFYDICPQNCPWWHTVNQI